MPEGFLQRWARRKATGVSRSASPESGARQRAQLVECNDAPAGDRSDVPTLADVARLSSDADYSAFVAHGMDSQVRRAAMKKLFSDPHFNVVDGLDIYMGDYTQSASISAAMLAALRHTQSLLEPTPLEDRSAPEEITAPVTSPAETDVLRQPQAGASDDSESAPANPPSPLRA